MHTLPVAQLGASMSCISGVKKVFMISVGLEPPSRRVRIVTVGDRFYIYEYMSVKFVYVE